MSQVQELHSPQAKQRLATEMQIPVEFRGVRSHHYRNYNVLFYILAHDPELSLVAASVRCADDLTEAYIESCRYVGDLEIQAPRSAALIIEQFRTRIGKSVDDSSVPRCQPEDCIGDDPAGYRNRLAQDSFALLTADEHTVVHVGAIKDGMCRATRWGYHCDDFCGLLDPNEAADLTRFYNLIIRYLALPEVKALADADPSKFIISTGELIRCAEDNVYTVGDSAILAAGLPHRLTSMDLTAGLMRDVWTWNESAGTYLTYTDLPQIQNGSIH